MTHFVDVEALNLRSQSGIAPNNRLGILHLGQLVQVLDGGTEKWHKVRTKLNETDVEGFVAMEIPAQPATGFVPHPSLRNPVSDAREVLVAAAIKQWLRFAKGLGRENIDPFYKYVGEMWKALKVNLDGKDVDTPWSAAAISFMVQIAATSLPSYAKFKFAAAHSKYMHDSIVKRNRGDTSVPFWGVQLHEALPQIGDIVGRWREVPRTFQDAATSDSFKSHSDVIVSVSPDFVLAIGGNISNSVGISRYPKMPSGHLSSSEGAIILMVNQADLVPQV
ncbi:MAG: DUF2272 domain-containing protein [Burkholderiaceae bacterium]|nr:DUF2272 domain-containing protein [Burkholderiaceae bacterium]